MVEEITNERSELVEPSGTFRDQIKLSSLEDGELIDNTVFSNKILILNLWATWCKPCIKEMPDLETMMTQLPEDFELILASDEDLVKIKRFAENKSKNLNFVKLESNPESLGVYALPTTFVIGKSGEVVETLVGARDWNSPENLEHLNKINQ